MQGKYDCIIECDNDKENDLLIELFTMLSCNWSAKEFDKYVID